MREPIFTYIFDYDDIYDSYRVEPILELLIQNKKIRRLKKKALQHSLKDKIIAENVH